MIDMHQWYYGSGRYPEKHDRKNAMAEMVLTIGAFVLVMGAWFVACILWLKGVI